LLKVSAIDYLSVQALSAVPVFEYNLPQHVQLNKLPMAAGKEGVECPDPRSPKIIFGPDLEYYRIHGIKIDSGFLYIGLWAVANAVVSLLFH
jgi:hypothetical protein